MKKPNIVTIVLTVLSGLLSIAAALFTRKEQNDMVRRVAETETKKYLDAQQTSEEKPENTAE